MAGSTTTWTPTTETTCPDIVRHHEHFSTPIRSALSALGLARGRVQCWHIAQEEEGPCSATCPMTYAHRDRYRKTQKNFAKALRRWYPEERPAPASDTFEIGLVLAGAVSAGAYTAGVMDFLFEALDAWYARRNDDDRLPNHNVVLRVIAGASAGGINGAIASAACRYRFPPVNRENVERNGPNNPFFSTWVTGIDIREAARYLRPRAGTPPSARCSTPKPWTSWLSASWGWQAKRMRIRPSRGWLANPFRLLLTVTNLSGRAIRRTVHGRHSLQPRDGHASRPRGVFGARAHQFHTRSRSAAGPRAAPPRQRRGPIRDGDRWRVTALASGAFPSRACGPVALAAGLGLRLPVRVPPRRAARRVLQADDRP